MLLQVHSLRQLRILRSQVSCKFLVGLIDALYYFGGDEEVLLIIDLKLVLPHPLQQLVNDLHISILSLPDILRLELIPVLLYLVGYYCLEFVVDEGVVLLVWNCCDLSCEDQGFYLLLQFF